MRLGKSSKIELKFQLFSIGSIRSFKHAEILGFYYPIPCLFAIFAPLSYLHSSRMIILVLWRPLLAFEVVNLGYFWYPILAQFII